MSTMHTEMHHLREARLAEQLEPLLALDDRTFVHSWGREGAPERLGFSGAGDEKLQSQWVQASVAPLVRASFRRLGRPRRIVTVLSEHDGGVRARGDGWLEFVRTQWRRHRVAWLLVSGCGWVDAPVPTFLVRPYCNRGWRHFQREALASPRWSRRRDELVFRGATTGGSGLTASNLFERLERARVLQALSRSGLPCDVAFSGVSQAKADHASAVRAKLEDAGLMAGPMDRPSMMSFRYQLMIDGNHGAWSAHIWKLSSGSTCLWLRGRSVNWFDDEFTPWVHYIPADEENLLERYRWARSNPREARAIARRSVRRSRRVFRKWYMFRSQRRAWARAWSETLGEPGRGAPSR